MSPALSAGFFAPNVATKEKFFKTNLFLCAIQLLCAIKRQIHLYKPTSLFIAEESRLNKEVKNAKTTAVAKIVNVKNYFYAPNVATKKFSKQTFFYVRYNFCAR